jgi:hypothetical protein
MLQILVFSAALAGTWHFETQRDPLGQSVYVAEVAPDDERPHVALRFLLRRHDGRGAAIQPR